MGGMAPSGAQIWVAPAKYFVPHRNLLLLGKFLVVVLKPGLAKQVR